MWLSGSKVSGVRPAGDDMRIVDQAARRSRPDATGSMPIINEIRRKSMWNSVFHFIADRGEMSS
jgi:hypothetical protein